MAECVEDIKHALIKVEEKGRKAVFRNPAGKEYQRVRIDDCLVKAGPRADWLIREVGCRSAIVELKGVDVAHACEQLFASAKHPQVKPYLEQSLGFLIVCSRYPRFDTFVAKAKQRAAREFKAGFHVVSDRGEFDIGRIASI